MKMRDIEIAHVCVRFIEDMKLQLKNDDYHFDRLAKMIDDDLIAVAITEQIKRCEERLIGFGATEVRTPVEHPNND